MLAGCARAPSSEDVEYLTEDVCKIHIRPVDGGCMTLEPDDAGFYGEVFVTCSSAVTACGITGSCPCPWDGNKALKRRTGWRPWKNWP